MARQFHGLLFLGNGQHSVGERRRLVGVLERALDLSGGLQQPDSIHEPPDPRRDALAADMHDEIKDAVRDIAAALLGQEISFGEVLPYPPKS